MSALFSTGWKTKFRHELIRHVHEIRERVYCSCSIRGSTIDLELDLRCCLPWLALALVLYYLPFFGLANSGCLLEILVEGPGIINADLALSILALTLCLVQHHYRGISNAVG